MGHFSEGKHLKEVTHIPLTYPHGGSTGGLVQQGLACHATAMLIKLFLQESSKSQRDAGSPLWLQPLPGMCLERRTHSLGPDTPSDCSAEQYGEHVAEDNSSYQVIQDFKVEVFSLHDPPSKQAQQETKRILYATKYRVLRFHFPTLLS